MDRLILRLERQPDGKHLYVAERYLYPTEAGADEAHDIRGWAERSVYDMSIELDKQELRDRGFIGKF